MTENLADGYSSEGVQRELSNEYQHDRVKMVFKNICILVLWTKVPSVSEGLTLPMLMLNPVMLVFIGRLSLSTLRWFQSFLQVIQYHFELIKLAINSINLI